MQKLTDLEQMKHNQALSEAPRRPLTAVEYKRLGQYYRLVKKAVGNDARRWINETGETPVESVARFAGVDEATAYWYFKQASQHSFEQRTQLLHDTTVLLYKTYSTGKNRHKNGLKNAQSWAKNAFGVRGKLP